MDRRFVYLGGVVIALIVLSLMGMTPQVLYQRAHEFVTSASSAATKTRELSDRREGRSKDATAVLDGLPGHKEKDPWTDRN